MPGHMNVLPAEAEVPNDQLTEHDEVNPEFPRTDVALVIGANDVVNPDARSNPQSPLSGEPAANPARNIWVTETALTTALNTAYFAESTATFVIAMGIALFLTGIGFLVVTLRVLRQRTAVQQSRRQPTEAVAVPH